MAIKMAFWRKWREDKSAKDMAGNDVANFNFELWRLHVWRTMKTMANGEGSAPTEMPVQYRRKSLSNSDSIHRGKAIAKR